MVCFVAIAISPDRIVFCMLVFNCIAAASLCLFLPCDVMFASFRVLCVLFVDLVITTGRKRRRKGANLTIVTRLTRYDVCIYFMEQVRKTRRDKTKQGG